MSFIIEKLLETNARLAEKIEKNLVMVAVEMAKKAGVAVGGYVLSGGEKFLVTSLALTDKGKLVVYGARVRLNGTVNKKPELLKSWKPWADPAGAQTVAKRRGRPPKIASDTPVAGNA